MQDSTWTRLHPFAFNCGNGLFCTNEHGGKLCRKILDVSGNCNNFGRRFASVACILRMDTSQSAEDMVHDETTSTEIVGEDLYAQEKPAKRHTRFRSARSFDSFTELAVKVENNSITIRVSMI